MQALIKKDLYTQQKMVYLFSLFWFIPITGFFTDGSPIRHVLLITFTSFTLVLYSNFNTTTSEEMQSRFINSLPVTRKQVVLGKYATGIIWYLPMALLVTIYVVLFNLFAPFPSRLIHLPEYIIALTIMYLLLSIFYPLLFSVGYKVASVLVGVIIPVTLLIGNQMIVNLTENPKFPEVKEFVASLAEKQWMIAGFLTLATLIISVISYQVSVKIYTKKDL